MDIEAPLRSMHRGLMEIPELFHERLGAGFRSRFRHELLRSLQVDVAVTRLRLSTLDLSDEELLGVSGIRLLLAEVRAVELDAEAHALMARPHARVRLRRLERLLDQDLVQIRVSPLGGWSPDFTVFHDRDGPRGVLVGFHAFEHPHPYRGPAFGAHFGRREALVAQGRFEEVWARGHDAAPAVHSIFRRARRWIADEGPGDGGMPPTPDPVDTPRTLG